MQQFVANSSCIRKESHRVSISSVLTEMKIVLYWSVRPCHYEILIPNISKLYLDKEDKVMELTIIRNMLF